ncbi:hypothetical protein [Thaumasiovibrio subtropicus]|uniref:hypothetical protein n=1 Tax=Thaumasiovibrio subtropicus TaxID=1891207 RepID=UPI000B34F4BB|nr:hypothetical protein [Thaumasiovibrio subtropicus]
MDYCEVYYINGEPLTGYVIDIDYSLEDKLFVHRIEIESREFGRYDISLNDDGELVSMLLSMRKQGAQGLINQLNLPIKIDLNDIVTSLDVIQDTLVLDVNELARSELKSLISPSISSIHLSGNHYSEDFVVDLCEMINPKSIKIYQEDLNSEELSIALGKRNIKLI